jgi:hypothetical protein
MPPFGDHDAAVSVTRGVGTRDRTTVLQPTVDRAQRLDHRRERAERLHNTGLHAHNETGVQDTILDDTAASGVR